MTGKFSCIKKRKKNCIINLNDRNYKNAEREMTRKRGHPCTDHDRLQLHVCNKKCGTKKYENPG